MLPSLKNPEIPELVDYAKKPYRNFWENFPGNYPNKIHDKVNVKGFCKRVKKCWSNWSFAKKKIAKLAMKKLRGMAPVHLKHSLGGINCKNAKTAIVHGRFMTDSIVSWLKKGFVA